MNSPSAASRRAAFDVPLAILIGVAALLLSRYLRGHFPTPDGNGWLWLCGAIGIAVAFGLSIRRGLTAVRWICYFAASYLAMQITLQALLCYGII